MLDPLILPQHLKALVFSIMPPVGQVSVLEINANIFKNRLHVLQVKLIFKHEKIKHIQKYKERHNIINKSEDRNHT